MDLGTTEDPRALIPGNPHAIDDNVTFFRGRGKAMGVVGAGLAAIDSGSWTGAAANKFRDRFSYEPAKWHKAGDAFDVTADALARWAELLRWGQNQAGEAVALWREGTQAAERAKAEHDAAIRAANQENQARASAGNPAMVEVPALTDPGAGDRAAAVDQLQEARRQLASAGDEIATIIGKCRDLAPEEPGFFGWALDKVGSFGEGALESLESGAEGILGLTSYTDGDHIRENVNTLAQGVIGMATDREGFLKALIDAETWAKDPARAMGHLLPDLAMSLTGVGAGTKAAEKAAEAAKTARVLARKNIPDPRATAMETKALRCENDPVSVASGQVVLSQTDVELPGALPLIVSRTHLSSYREGRSYGASWASTWDERIEFDGLGFVFFRADGVVLFYPHPLGTPVLPAEGPRWPLELCSDGYQITDPETGHRWRFTRRYGSVLPVTEVTDRVGHQLEFEHDAEGTPIAIRHSGGYHLQAEHENGRITALHLADERLEEGKTELIRYGYDEASNLASVSTASQLDSSQLSSPEPLRFSYDSQGRLQRWEDRNGHWYEYIYDNEGRCIRNDSSSGYLTGSFHYVSTEPATAEPEPGIRTTIFTDALGQAHTFFINALDQVVKEIDPLGNETQTEWDRYDRLLRRTDPLGRVSEYFYDETGNLMHTVRPDGARITAEYNALRQPITLVAPDGAQWERSYNAAGNLTELIDPLGAVTRYGYDQMGHLSTVEEPDGQRYLITSNAAGLLVTITDPLGATTTYERDAFGRVTSITDPLGGITSMGWSVEGKPTWRTQVDGTIERWKWDGEGNLVEHTDPLGNISRTEYGAFDLPTAEIRVDGTRLEYNYDPLLRLSSVTNPQGKVWRYEYDHAGRVVREIDFTDRELRYSYNSAAELTERVNGAGEAIRFTRDVLGRVTERRNETSTSHFEYDPVGRLIGATNADAELRYETDLLGRVLVESVNGRSIRSTYDTSGNRVSRTTPSGVTSVWEYNSAGRPEKLSSAGRELEFSYDRAGREVTRSLGSGVVLSQAWDGNHRLKQQLITAPGRQLGTSTGDPGQVLQQRMFSYRPDGAVTGIDDLLAGVQRFDLDALGRATAVQGQGWAERYTYDASGDISSAVWPHGDTESQGLRSYRDGLVESAGTVRYVHDRQGRVVMRQKKRLSRKPDTWRYSWDSEDRLVGVFTPDGRQWRYTYDPLGRRISKLCLSPDGHTLTELTEFTWDGDTLAEQHNSDGQAMAWDYEPGTHRPITQHERSTDLQNWSQGWVDQAFYAIVTDLVGTPTELVDGDGNLVRRRRTGLWGQALAGVGRSDVTPLGFPGQYFDAESGFYYNYHRHYDPDTGRYMSQDPLRLAAGLIPTPTYPTPPPGSTL